VEAIVILQAQTAPTAEIYKPRNSKEKEIHHFFPSRTSDFSPSQMCRKRGWQKVNTSVLQIKL
jgi:hypothetical protein